MKKTWLIFFFVFFQAAISPGIMLQQPSMLVTWKANTEPDLLGYIAQLTSAEFHNAAWFVELPETSILFSNFPDGNYEIRICAIDSALNSSSWSDPVYVSLPWPTIQDSMKIINPDNILKILLIFNKKLTTIPPVNIQWLNFDSTGFVSAWSPLKEENSDYSMHGDTLWVNAARLYVFAGSGFQWKIRVSIDGGANWIETQAIKPEEIVKLLRLDIL